MIHLVLCIFHVENTSLLESKQIYAALEKLGLKKIHHNIKIASIAHIIPTSTTIGEFKGNDPAAIRQMIHSQVQALLNEIQCPADFSVIVKPRCRWVSKGKPKLADATE